MALAIRIVNYFDIASFRVVCSVKSVRYKHSMFLKISIGVGNERVFKIIPLHWVKDVQMVTMLNQGLFRFKNSTFKVFFSDDIEAEPDFQLKANDKFIPNRTACYNAILLKAFGKNRWIL